MKQFGQTVCANSFCQFSAYFQEKRGDSLYKWFRNSLRKLCFYLAIQIQKLVWIHNGWSCFLAPRCAFEALMFWSRRPGPFSCVSWAVLLEQYKESVKSEMGCSTTPSDSDLLLTCFWLDSDLKSPFPGPSQVEITSKSSPKQVWGEAFGGVGAGGVGPGWNGSVALPESLEVRLFQTKPEEPSILCFFFVSLPFVDKDAYVPNLVLVTQTRPGD